MTHHRIAIRLAGILTLGTALVALAYAPMAHAGKPAPTPTTPPPPPPLDGGTLHYAEQGGPGIVHELAPDGSGDRVVAGVTLDNSLIGTKPSPALHNGTRWFAFAQAANGGAAYFPDGRPLFDVFVTFEGAPGPLQLTGNGAACVSMYGPSGVYLDWAPDAGGQVDGAVAFVGKLWTDAGNGGSPCDTAGATGIFRAELTFDGAGSVTGIVAQPAAPEFAVSADSFAFRPDGQQVAYESNRKLFLAPDPTGIGQFGANYVAVGGLAWSPTGAKIAFAGGSDGTFTINPDNTGLTRLAQGRLAKRSGQSSLIHRNVSWSPNGTHLIYTEYETWYGTSNYTYRVRRMTATGADNVALPTIGPKGGFSLGWGAD